MDQKTLWEDEKGAELPAVFRPIHYLGSKLRLVDQIRDTVDEVDPSNGSVCDLFAGSGTVASALSRSRSVTAVDIQEYSRVLCSALLIEKMIPRSVFQSSEQATELEVHKRLRSAIEPLVEHENKSIVEAAKGKPEMLRELLEHGSIIGFELSGAAQMVGVSLRRAMSAATSGLRTAGLSNSVESLTTRFYGGIYFSYWQAAHLDALLSAADAAELQYRDSALALALSVASDVVNTVGKHFAQPLRLQKRDGSIKHSLVAKVQRDRGLDPQIVVRKWIDRYAELRPSQFHQRAVRADYHDFLTSTTENFSVVYADPPYTRDHYSRYYHILETMAKRDIPVFSDSNLERLVLSRGLYRSDRYQSPFCIKSRAPDAFRHLFEKCRQLNVSLVLSYSPYEKGGHPRLMTIDQLVASGRVFFPKIDVRPVGTFAHSKLNSSDRALTAAAEAEVLLICRQ